RVGTRAGVQDRQRRGGADGEGVAAASAVYYQGAEVGEVVRDGGRGQVGDRPAARDGAHHHGPRAVGVGVHRQGDVVAGVGDLHRAVDPLHTAGEADGDLVGAGLAVDEQEGLGALHEDRVGAGAGVEKGGQPVYPEAVVGDGEGVAA